jgi:hypothetical protein
MYKGGPIEGLFTGTADGDVNRQILQLKFQSVSY